MNPSSNTQSLVYEKPQALRLSGRPVGAGVCSTGNGDSGDCGLTGSGALNHCYYDGSSAGVNCSDDGSSATQYCLNDGSSPALCSTGSGD
jgi:hypothetical protein